MEELTTLFFYDRPSRSVLPQHVFLNNYYYSPISHEGLTYPTVEHFYQAHKYPLESKEFELIRTCVAPNQSKQLTRGLPYDEDWWNSVKVDVMRLALRVKFTQNPEQRRDLQLTWNCQLIEDSPRDMFWGGLLPGSKNMLGELLKEERERLRNEGNDRRVPPLYWLLKPYHPIFPAPVSAPKSILEAIYQVAPSTDLQAAVSQHPVFSLLPPASLSVLVSTAVQFSLSPLESVLKTQTFAYVLAGSGVYESDRSYLLSAGVWIEASQQVECKYTASESGLTIAELNLSTVLASLPHSDLHGRLIETILWKAVFLTPFRTKVSELRTSRSVLASQLSSALTESLPFLFTPNAVLDSLLYLPVTACATIVYSIDLQSCSVGVEYEERSDGHLWVRLGTDQLEQFTFYIAIFEELKRRIREGKVPKEVDLHLVTHIPKYWKKCLQAEFLQEVTVCLTDTKRAQVSGTPYFTQFAISSVDIVFADVQKCAYLFSPYLQTISESAKSNTSTSFPNECKTALYCSQFNLLVNPEQPDRAAQLDSLVGVQHTVIKASPALVLSPGARALLGCAEGDAHLICLDVSCGESMIDVLQEIAERIRSVRIVEKHKERDGNAEIGGFVSDLQSLVCETGFSQFTDVVTGFVPAHQEYFLDPFTAHCLHSLSRDFTISDISPNALSALTALLSIRKVPVRAVVPCSEASEMQLISEMSGKISGLQNIHSGVIFIQYGSVSEPLSQLYEAAAVLLRPDNVHEVLSAAWHFKCTVQTTALDVIREHLVSLLKLQSPHLQIAWSDFQTCDLMRTVQRHVQVFIFSDVHLDLELSAEVSPQVTILTTSRDVGHPTALVCELEEGTWVCRGASQALSLTQVLSQTHFT